MKRKFTAYVLSIILLSPAPLFAFELKSRYVTIACQSKELLKDFNNALRLNRNLRYYVSQRNPITIEDEVLAKVDTLIEKAETVLEMFPNNLHIRLQLYEERGDIAQIFKRKYGKKVNHIAFYSLKEDTIYISVDDTNLQVLAHEIGHAVVDHFFEVRPPYNIHELMAQFTEKHITD